MQNRSKAYKVWGKERTIRTEGNQGSTRRKIVNDLLMERRQKQIELLTDNKEFMEEWIKKGWRDWTKNK